tara:strand:- start:358 stop:1623 length:1266 start_codon:yes stop_codon:yes gene_type:complete
MQLNPIKIIEDLFPIHRSITGPGIKKSLTYLEKLVPNFKRLKFKSGKKVFDWIVPEEWIIKDSYITDTKNKKHAEFKKNNLHILGFSEPMQKVVGRKELFKNIYTEKNQPSSIPYVTSYYKKKWGFCMSEEQKKKLKGKKFKVYINSKFVKGNLELSHALFKGKSKKEIFFSTYLCHPSMANNELSGPSVLINLADYVKKIKNRKFSYRFVILPETIGSICYISKFKSSMQKNIICGFNLSCVGDDNAYSHIESKDRNTLADQALSSALIGKKNFKTYSFLTRGSDERQYCSPLVNLPVCGFSRSKYFEYKEYHTDKDNLDFVTQKGLNNSIDVMKTIINSFETSLKPKSKIVCEPMLSKRKLHPTTSVKNSYSSEILLRRDIIAYSDGTKNIFQISKILKKPLKNILDEVKILIKNKIIG